MRILHVDKFLPGRGVGGVRRVVETLGSQMRRRGHETLTFGCAFDAEDSVHPPFVDFTRAPWWRLGQMLHNPRAATMLDRYLAHHDVDVAHLHNVYHHLTPSILPVFRRRGIAVVMTLHDYRLACPTRHFARPDGLCMRCLPNRLYHAMSPACASLRGAALAGETFVQRFLRRYASGVDRFHCLTGFMRDVMIRAGLPRNKCVVIPAPVAVVDPPPPPPSERLLLFAGRLRAEKNPSAMLTLAEAIPDAQVVLVGDGPCRADLEAELSRRQPGSVRLLGALPWEELRCWYARASAVVLPSVCMENSPQTMLEAMAAGRAVIVPDQAPLREWITDGGTGRLVPTGDHAALVRVVRDVLAHPPAAEAMGAAAREVIRHRHDPDRVTGELEALYESAGRQCALR